MLPPVRTEGLLRAEIQVTSSTLPTSNPPPLNFGYFQTRDIGLITNEQQLAVDLQLLECLLNNCCFNMVLKGLPSFTAKGSCKVSRHHNKAAKSLPHYRNLPTQSHSKCATQVARIKIIGNILHYNYTNHDEESNTRQQNIKK